MSICFELRHAPATFEPHFRNFGLSPWGRGGQANQVVMRWEPESACGLTFEKQSVRRREGSRISTLLLLLHISHGAQIKFGSKGLDHSQHAAYFNARIKSQEPRAREAHTFISREFPSITGYPNA